MAPVPEAFATDLGAPQERSCRGLDGRCWWADGPGHHSSSLLQLPGHEPKTSHPLLTHVTSASRPVHWAGLVRMGTGSDACLGWYNREQSCENESLCLEMASLGLRGQGWPAWHHVAGHLRVPRAAPALHPCKVHPRDRPELREVPGDCWLPSC